MPVLFGKQQSHSTQAQNVSILIVFFMLISLFTILVFTPSTVKNKIVQRVKVDRSIVKYLYGALYIKKREFAEVQRVETSYHEMKRVVKLVLKHTILSFSTIKTCSESSPKLMSVWQSYGQGTPDFKKVGLKLVYGLQYCL
ncbi:hypothetical protein FGO68_gene394 [Halteria grandinella]|uniref:Uncharacterized protein n=1 Tax=Halteria grandinella TaxID=5974 RepID=A0A8J8P6D4_HALGN|nr:hypothetical protein FGO68_gene394 [Halteria grandinella]